MKSTLKVGDKVRFQPNNSHLMEDGTVVEAESMTVYHIRRPGSSVSRVIEMDDKFWLPVSILDAKLEVAE